MFGNAKAARLQKSGSIQINAQNILPVQSVIPKLIIHLDAVPLKEQRIPPAAKEKKRILANSADTLKNQRIQLRNWLPVHRRLPAAHSVAAVLPAVEVGVAEVLVVAERAVVGNILRNASHGVAIQ